MVTTFYDLLPMPFTEAAIRWTYRLRNDPETRANSLDTAEVEFETHVRWFKKRMLANPEALRSGVMHPVIRSPLNWWYMKNEDRSIGHARLDLRVIPDAGYNPIVYEISVTVDPLYRGQGYGKNLIRAVAEIGRRDYEVLALIKNENTASLKAFAAAGFDEYSNHRSDTWRPPHDVKVLRKPALFPES